MPSLIETFSTQHTATRVGKDAVLKGTIRFHEPTRIAGTFEGIIEASSLLMVEEGAVIRAQVRGTDMIIAGEIHGDIDANGMVELLPTAKVHGNIRTSKIRVCDGVVFEGRCEMLRNIGPVDLFSAPIRELRKAIHVADEQQ
jgi:cytoskeletal protein CcmA (bactofilin family)